MNYVCEFDPICLGFENKSRVLLGPARRTADNPCRARLAPPTEEREQRDFVWTSPHPLQHLPMRGKDFLGFFFWLLSLAVLTRRAPRGIHGSGFLRLTSWAFVAAPCRLLHRMAGVRGPGESRASAMAVEQDMFDAVVMADER